MAALAPIINVMLRFYRTNQIRIEIG
jgi:hypothetical protein